MNTETAPDISASNEAKWKIRNLKVDTFTKIISTASIMIAVMVGIGTLAAQRDQVAADGIASALLELKTSFDVEKISDEKSLVTINVDLVNHGKHTIHPYAHTDDPKGKETYSGEGLTISVTRHELGSPDSKINDAGERVIGRHNLLEERYSYGGELTWDWVYSIKPGTTYRESEPVLLRRRALYEVVVRFYANQKDDTWTTTETKYIYVD